MIIKNNTRKNVQTLLEITKKKETTKGLFTYVFKTQMKTLILKMFLTLALADEH